MTCRTEYHDSNDKARITGSTETAQLWRQFAAITLTLDTFKASDGLKQHVSAKSAPTSPHMRVQRLNTFTSDSR
jgi:hypothetical protein